MTTDTPQPGTVAEILLKLYGKKELPEQEVCDFVLESSLPITASTIGFFGFLNDDESIMTIHAWSKNVMAECATQRKPIEFNIHGAGIWGEAVRKKLPVMVNDFTAPSPLKKGTPEGHVVIRRFLAVPLVYDDKVVAVLAVGNKTLEYDDSDIEQVLLLLEGLWQILLRRRAEEELVSTYEKINHFANAIAHDLKSPAIAAYGFAKMLKEKYSGVLDEKGLRYCDQIMKCSEQISHLAADINTYISSRDSVWDFETIELRELWNTARQEFVTQLQEQKVQWLEPEIGTVAIRGNKIGLLRVLRNLIDNALKYGGAGLSEITMGYELSPYYHILKVQNNGEVIKPEDVHDIFLEFKRKSHNTKIYGTGLGLSIVMEIAKKHKGSSWLTSSADGKTVFCVSISRSL